jgi:hypothetical protein
VALHGRPYLEVKKARIARAGKQIYSADEIAARGLDMKRPKAFYTEYRPPEVLLKNIEKFNYVPFVNEHTPVSVTPENWKEYAIGVVGGNAGVEVTDDGEIFVTNDVVFYDRAAYDEYKAGKRSISAGYDVKFAAVRDPEAAGFDLVMTDIPQVNHVALCSMARAGVNARVLDSVNAVDSILGGYEMSKVSVFSFLRKSKDSGFSLSKALLDGVAKVGTLDAAGLKTEIDGVMAHITPLGDGDMKTALVSAVADSFKHPVEVLAQKEAVAKTVDGLYGKCLDADEKAAAAIQDALKDGEEEPEDEDKKDKKDKKPEDKEAPVKDTAAVVDRAVKEALAGVTDSIKKDVASLVDAAVKDALGLGKGGKSVEKEAPVEDAAEDFDVSDLVASAWGRR